MPATIVGNTSTLLGLLLAGEKESFKAILKGKDIDLLSLSTKEEEGTLPYGELGKYTLLQHAIINDKPEFVESLLEANINPNIGDGKKKPLLLAAEYGRHEILKQFLEFNFWKQFLDEGHKSEIDFDVCALNSKKGEPKSGGENVLHLGNDDRKSLKNRYDYNLFRKLHINLIFMILIVSNFSIKTSTS